MFPIITVSISAYNRSGFLKEALESLRKQTFKDFKVLVSDNASTEDLSIILGEFEDLEITHIRHPKSLGMVGNWQYSLLAPRTTYVGWLHDDDYWEPDHLQRAIDALEKMDNAFLWSCAIRHYCGNKTLEIQVPKGFEDADTPTVFETRQTLPLWLFRQNAQCSSAVFRRSALDAIWWGPKNLCHRLDYLILSQCALRGKWIYDPKPTAGFRLGNEDKMSKKTEVLSTAAAQSQYVIRYLVDFSLRTNQVTSNELAEKVKSWPLIGKAGLFCACKVFFASRPARSFAEILLRVSPEILESASTSRVCKIARKVGLWIISAAEIFKFIKSGWYPIGSQNPDEQLLLSAVKR